MTISKNIAIAEVLMIGLFSTAALAAGTLQVVATTTTLKSLAEEVGGIHVEVTAICKPLQDPHFVQAKPSLMIKARNADLWIRNGMELEIGYENLIIQGSRNQKIRIGADSHLDASTDVLRLEVPLPDTLDRSLGDVHPLGNPHYWLDPWNGRIVAKTICKRLQLLDPQHGADYEKNLGIFQKQLDTAMFGAEAVEAIGGETLWHHLLAGTLDEFFQVHNEIRLGGWVTMMKPFAGRKVVTYHRSFPYLFNRFGLDGVIELEPKPGIPPGSRHLAEVVEKMKTQKIDIILLEPYYPLKEADLVAETTGTTAVVVPNAVNEKSDDCSDYISMINNILEKLTNVWTKK